MFGLDRSIGETTSPLPITILPQLETIFMRFRGSKTLRDKCAEEPIHRYTLADLAERVAVSGLGYQLLVPLRGESIIAAGALPADPKIASPTVGHNT
jgi:hypothetical protein